MALTRLQRRRRKRRGGRRRKQASSRAGAVLLTSAELEGDKQMHSAKKHAIAHGVLLAVFCLTEIVLYRMVERHAFYSTEEKPCACPGREAHIGDEPSQNSTVSLLKPTWCQRQVMDSQSVHGYREGAVSLPGAGKSCSCTRPEAGTEDSSPWRDALPHLRPTQCLRTALNAAAPLNPCTLVTQPSFTVTGVCIGYIEVGHCEGTCADSTPCRATKTTKTIDTVLCPGPAYAQYTYEKVTECGCVDATCKTSPVDTP